MFDPVLLHHGSETKCRTDVGSARAMLVCRAGRRDCAGRQTPLATESVEREASWLVEAAGTADAACAARRQERRSQVFAEVTSRLSGEPYVWDQST